MMVHTTIRAVLRRWASHTRRKARRTLTAASRTLGGVSRSRVRRLGFASDMARIISDADGSFAELKASGKPVGFQRAPAAPGRGQNLPAGFQVARRRFYSSGAPPPSHSGGAGPITPLFL